MQHPKNRLRSPISCLIECIDQLWCGINWTKVTGEIVVRLISIQTFGCPVQIKKRGSAVQVTFRFPAGYSTVQMISGKLQAGQENGGTAGSQGLVLRRPAGVGCIGVLQHVPIHVVRASIAKLGHVSPLVSTTSGWPGQCKAAGPRPGLHTAPPVYVVY
ncbi:hypothetical protein PVAP13_7NG375821 [Panicum virgatum]|uniref:Uncharacterized protein n=1 Tax=Panicum virgatum TaxID=38727 RepID=A0A8T0Q8W5_PANVG|nr:hypothetical protein PVAP13_7NG375821 [Panicum virgatum]